MSFLAILSRNCVVPVQVALPQRSHLGDDREVRVAVQHQSVAVERSLRQPQVHGAAHRQATAAKVEGDAGSVAPRGSSRFGTDRGIDQDYRSSAGNSRIGINAFGSKSSANPT